MLFSNFFHIFWINYALLRDVQSDHNNYVELTFNLFNRGFHRNLTYNIDFNVKSKEFEDCHIAINQMLPAGIYTNPDELEDYRRSVGLKAIPNHRVDVESPSEKASPLLILVFGKVIDSTARVWVPVHARYHAVSNRSMTTNKIIVPNIYLKCDRDVKSDILKQKIVLPCPENVNEKCLWYYVNYKVTDSNQELRWDVPVGNTDHYLIVALGTIIAVVVSSIYILKSIHEYQKTRRKFCKVSPSSVH